MNRWAQIVDTCCRDLRRYLEETLAKSKGGVVAVKMRRLLRVELSMPDRIRYSICLSRILGQWRWGSAYVIPRQDVEKILESFDSLCESVRQAKTVEKRPQPKRRQRFKEELVFISVTLQNDLLRAVDEYAHRCGLSRSEVIRRAIQDLLEARRTLEELDRAKNGDLEIVALRLPRDLLDALNEHAATLKATRSAIIRYAIHMLLQRINATPAP
jgi:metal-responsive CopG/Arc/MetJ family transcriptional regulator